MNFIKYLVFSLLLFVFLVPSFVSADFPADMPYDNDLTIITGIIQHYSTSSGLLSYDYIYYHIPFIFWVIVAVVSLWIASRLIIEFIIRWRRF